MKKEKYVLSKEAQKRYWDDSVWICKNMTEITRAYPDEWVAVVDKKAAAHGKTISEVKKTAREKTGRRGFPSGLQNGASVPLRVKLKLDRRSCEALAELNWSDFAPLVLISGVGQRALKVHSRLRLALQVRTNRRTWKSEGIIIFARYLST